jgi:hypothetical protein
VGWRGGGGIRWQLVESSIPALYMGTKLLVEVAGLQDKLRRVLEVIRSITMSTGNASLNA